MLLCLSFVILILVKIGECQQESEIEKLNYQLNIENWLKEVESTLAEFNFLAARITWDLSTNPSDKTVEYAKITAKVHTKWKNKVCESEIKKNWLTKEQSRKLTLFCRGPKYHEKLILLYLDTAARLSQAYNKEICLSPMNFTVKFDESDIKPDDCVLGEPDLENMMKNPKYNPEQLQWIWETWHNFVGPPIGNLFNNLLVLQTWGAHENGYDNIGEVWREELEIPHLSMVVDDLYAKIFLLYSVLHAVVRHKLYQKYGPTQIDLKGPIPIHLLGNMWGQDWSPLIDLFVPPEEKLNLDERLQTKYNSVKEMVEAAEDFYSSLGLPKMTEKFWRNSIFEKSGNTSVCHGSAANLYSPGDYRMIMCGEITMYDFYVIHHEMGHVEYYMAYEDQPSIFQDGANSALHESIGDAIMHGVMTPQHLNRIGLLSDEELSDESVELYLLLQQALSKIPEIPFALVLDKYRWELFKLFGIPNLQRNSIYWKMNLEYRGIRAPENRSEEFFDAGAKFHVSDNTPYIRYFLSSFLQMDIFKSLCKVSIYGTAPSAEDEHDLNLPLHRCDIYGSKKTGKILRSMMERGSSIKWDEALEMLTGHSEIRAQPLLEYYKPVYKWLLKYIKKHDVYVGWN